MQRLDVKLSQLYSLTRSQAIDAIKSSYVSVNNKLITKPSTQVSEKDHITLDKAQNFVSRGGNKLYGVIKDANIHVKDKECLDVGASTGGFTDCLLQQDAASVVCVDVGSNQLHHSLQKHPKVTFFEHTNINQVHKDDLGKLFDIIVVDVSFTSIRHVFDAVVALLKHDGEMLILFKPQFEVGKEHLNKKGIVKEEAVVHQVKEQVQSFIESYGFNVDVFPCSLKGKEGNQEYFYHIKR